MPTEVFVHFHPEGHNQIQYHGRSEREERRINKIQPDAAGRDTHLLAQAGAYTKSLLFNEISNLFHTSLRYKINAL